MREREREFPGEIKKQLEINTEMNFKFLFRFVFKKNGEREIKYVPCDLQWMVDVQRMI